MSAVGIALLALMVAAVATGLVRRHALKRELLDVPNERSSHQTPTPRGGGLAIVLATMFPFAVLTAAGVVDRDLFSALIVGGGAVAVIGYLDDRLQLSARIRLVVHFAAAAWALWVLGGLPPLHFLDYPVSLGPIGYVVGTIGIVWVLNLFNFMDGIDGIAASEGVFISLAAALLAWIAGAHTGAIFNSSLVLSAACLGFLLWNWPPAKIFMGDVGSGYLGYVVGVLAIADARETPLALVVWPILGGVFLVDATVTLMRRLMRRDRVYEAHRSHAYQWLSRRWRSHKRVTVAVLMVNLTWLLPCALLATAYPAAAGWFLLAALTPLVMVAFWSGAGLPETKADSGDPDKLRH